ncbi:MAG: amidohydrolase family protein [Telmatospirillum sp.]|nr:amidohydrolase family protein [Telmatospirillum sp.]
MSCAIVNARILPAWDGTFATGAILVEDGRIAGIARGADTDAMAARARETFDAKGATVLPGLVNAHHHAYANVLRGTENALPLELWALFTVAFGRGLDERLLRLGILLGAAEMARAGVTCVVDHSPPVRHFRASHAAHLESGLRVAFAPFLHDRHDHDILGFALPDAIRAEIEGAGFPDPAFICDMFDELGRTDGGGRVRTILGPNAPQRCSPALLDLWAQLAARHGMGAHTHLLETEAQAIACWREWPEGVVAHLDARGLLDACTAVAHGIWLAPAERDLLARRGTTVVHNPASNLMLGSGILPLADLEARGVPLALGSDSANTGGTADMFELMRLATMIGRSGTDWRSWPRAETALRMATEGGARAAGLSGRTGRIETGYMADLVVLDLSGAAVSALETNVEALVRHGGAHQVRATMVGGDWIYREGRIRSFDEAAVLAEFTQVRAAFLDERAHALGSARKAMEILAQQLQTTRLQEMIGPKRD